MLRPTLLTAAAIAAISAPALAGSSELLGHRLRGGHGHESHRHHETHHGHGRDYVHIDIGNAYPGWDRPHYWRHHHRPVYVVNNGPYWGHGYSSSVIWANPRPAYRYTLLPTEISYNDRNDDGDERYCREYTARATIGRNARDTYGTACLQPDGSWEIVN